MQINELFSKALNINEPWYVSDISFDPEHKRLTISIDFKRGSTFHYESEDKKICGDYKAYDTIEKEWRHLNFFEHECYLKARVPRVKTEDGGIHITSPDWSGLLNGFTLLFEAFIMLLSKTMPIHQLSNIIKESDHKIWTVIDKYVESTVDQNNHSELTAFGMDETSIAKGHEYVTTFVDLNQKKTVFVTEGKDAKTVDEFKSHIESHQGKPENITDVSCDMSPAFINGVNKNFPQAEITFDKFHIIKVINEAVDSVRRQESKSNPLLKGTRYIFLKNDTNLTEFQKATKFSLSKLNLKSMRALNIRESFQQIYTAKTLNEFETLLKKWYFWATHSKLEPMKKAAKTIKSHWDGIVNWKKSQINNGILEGLNSIIQAAKAKAKGYATFKHFKNIIYLITGNLDFSKINPKCLPT